MFRAALLEGRMRIPMLNQFIKNDDGAITPFVIAMFLTMVVGGGMGVDFMRHEAERAALQDALDRGVLAAASYEVSKYETSANVTVDLEARVASYLESSENLKNRNPELVITSNISELSRQVSASGNYEINTFFLKLIGITTLPVVARATAISSINEVEISLILDNSGSMNGDKIQDLKTAANTFIDLVLNDNTVDHTTISLIPFAAQVNAGPVLAAEYNLAEWQDYSWCFEFDSDDYRTTSLSQVTSFGQEQNYYRGNYGTNECPASTIIPFSNNPTVLKTAINNMQAGGYTATYAGMKWGAALLDPVAQPVVNSLIANGVVNPIFAGRPLAWDDEGLKFIILMTDGANTTHRRIRPSNYNSEGTASWRSQENADYWNGRRCRSGDGCSTETVTSASAGDSRLDAICASAKAPIPGDSPLSQRIIVYTIGFDVSVGSNPYVKMRDCASSASRFYHVGTADLTAAFVQIAKSINKLKLSD